ncbi:IS30 family transposase [Rhizobium mongolense]|uniref:IS30 family transposase n=1 Tax=Rhizobium mongolense TaxID=57676 RepID=A0A7W6WHI5_9HYPH|nr:IS30 family transposase [Rhizobium mongolense]
MLTSPHRLMRQLALSFSRSLQRPERPKSREDRIIAEWAANQGQPSFLDAAVEKYRIAALKMAGQDCDTKVAALPDHGQDHQCISSLPSFARRSFTFDRGTEFAGFRPLEDGIGAMSRFCDPNSPWQKGAVENTSKRIRRFLQATRTYPPSPSDSLSTSTIT